MAVKNVGSNETSTQTAQSEVQPQVDSAAVASQDSPEVAALKAKVAKLEAENKSMVESAGSITGSFPRSDATTSTKPTYKFSVSAKNKPALPKLEILAVDESEAIRLYSLRALPGEVLDTVSITWSVTCSDEEKAKRKANNEAARRQRHAAMDYVPEVTSPAAMAAMAVSAVREAVAAQ